MGQRQKIGVVVELYSQTDRLDEAAKWESRVDGKLESITLDASDRDNEVAAPEDPAESTAKEDGQK